MGVILKYWGKYKKTVKRLETGCPEKEKMVEQGNGGFNYKLYKTSWFSKLHTCTYLQNIDSYSHYVYKKYILRKSRKL